MDIWSWVWPMQQELEKLGHFRLADIMDRVPTATCDGQAREVEALVAEGLALARAAKQPWVEVFLRHWRMQSRAFHECDVREGIGEAVELLDFAHQDATVGCPQSICATQDFAHTHALLDGTGHAGARLAACEETLARIDRSWPCWVCIGAERGNALLDARRFDEALEYALAEIVALESLGRPATLIYATAVSALLGQGRADEARKLTDKTREANSGSTGETRFRLRKALVLGRLGEREAALDLLVDPSTLTPQHYVEYARVLRELVRLGAHDVVSDRLVFAARTVQQLARRGSRLLGLVTARVLAETASLLGLFGFASDLLDEAEHLSHGLIDPSRELARIAEIRARIPHDEPEDPEDAWARRAGCDLQRLAGVSLDALTNRARTDEALFHRLVDRLPREGAGPMLDRLLDRTADVYPRRVRFLRAEIAHERGDHAAARSLLAPLLDDGRSTHAERMLFARILIGAAAYLEAVAWLRSLPTDGDDAEDIAWALAVAATCARDHRATREAALRLGYDVASDLDEPIRLRAEPIAVERMRDDGSVRILLADRISPVSARVVSFGTPGEQTPFGDLIVFDPTPIAETGAEVAGAGPRFTFREVHVLETHPRVFHSIEGVRSVDSPTPDALIDMLGAFGWHVFDTSVAGARWGDEQAPPHHHVRIDVFVPSSEDAHAAASRVRDAIAIDGYYLVADSLFEAADAFDAIDDAYARRDSFLLGTGAGGAE